MKPGGAKEEEPKKEKRAQTVHRKPVTNNQSFLSTPLKNSTEKKKDRFWGWMKCNDCPSPT
jgi:hypothetical protein